MVTTGSPIASKCQKLDGEKLVAANAEFKSSLNKMASISGKRHRGPALYTWYTWADGPAEISAV
jgi:hypothetical protein